MVSGSSFTSTKSFVLLAFIFLLHHTIIESCYSPPGVKFSSRFLDENCYFVVPRAQKAMNKMSHKNVENRVKEAQAVCDDHRATLPIVESPSQSDFLIGLVEKHVFGMDVGGVLLGYKKNNLLTIGGNRTVIWRPLGSPFVNQSNGCVVLTSTGQWSVDERCVGSRPVGVVCMFDDRLDNFGMGRIRLKRTANPCKNESGCAYKPTKKKCSSEDNMCYRYYQCIPIKADGKCQEFEAKSLVSGSDIGCCARERLKTTPSSDCSSVFPAKSALLTALIVFTGVLRTSQRFVTVE